MKTMKTLLLTLLTFVTLNLFSTTYIVTRGLTTNVTCEVGDTLEFRATSASVWGVNVNGMVKEVLHPVTTSPYIIYTYVVVSGDTSFCITNTSPSLNWCGNISIQYTGIKDLKVNKLNLVVFPNPTSDYFKIKDLKTAKVSLYDQLGRLVFYKEFEDEDIRIEVMTLPDAIYLVEAVVDNKKSVSKLMKIK